MEDATKQRDAVIDLITSQEARKRFFEVSSRAKKDMGSGMIREFRKALLGRELEVAPFNSDVKCALVGDSMNPKVTLDFLFMIVYDFLSGDDYDLPDHETGLMPVWLHSFRMLETVKHEYDARNITVPRATAGAVIDEVVRYWNEGRLPHFVESVEDGEVTVGGVVYRNKAMGITMH